MKILFGNHTNKVTFKLFIFLKNISLCKFDQNDQPKNVRPLKSITNYKH